MYAAPKSAPRATYAARRDEAKQRRQDENDAGGAQWKPVDAKFAVDVAALQASKRVTDKGLDSRPI